ncbi:hypothetical protein CDAR_197791 [Caerostris darwini]|uniref:Uncharacterized protein n=1 Tax=Caerostris darwini TaxID=1538125 RepID=A0AAV4SCQ3_9ARAC|nr:hypothetical protein CDAR_197791 [Caerostris darwini]
MHSDLKKQGIKERKKIGKQMDRQNKEWSSKRERMGPQGWNEREIEEIYTCTWVSKILVYFLACLLTFPSDGNGLVFCRANIQASASSTAA